MRPSRTLSHAIILAALAFGAGGAQAASFRGIAHIARGHVAWIHSRPNTASPRVGYLRPTDLRVHTLACKRLAAGGWCLVLQRGTRGWVQDRFLTGAAVMRG